MADPIISQEVNIEMLEKLADGTFKIKYPKTKADLVIGLTKEHVGLGNVKNYGIATQTEAEAGTSNAKYMTPLRVKQAINSAKVISVFSGRTTKAGDGVYDDIVIPLGKVPTKYIKLLGMGSFDSYGSCFIDLVGNMFYGFEIYYSSDKVRSIKKVAELGTFDSWTTLHILGAANPSSYPRLTGVTVSGSNLILRYIHNSSISAGINNLIVEAV